MTDGARQLAAALESAACAASGRVFILGALDAAQLPKVAEKIHAAEAQGDAAVVVAPLDHQMPFAKALLRRAKDTLQRDVVAVPPLQKDADFIAAADLICAFVNNMQNTPSLSPDSPASPASCASPESLSPSDSFANAAADLSSSDNATLHFAAVALKENDLTKARTALLGFLQNDNRTPLAEALVQRLAVQEALAHNDDAHDAVARLQKISAQLTTADEALTGVGAFLLAYQARQALRDVL